jgi:hypothetical protein
MADEARRLGFKPDDATEWLPVIEGYSNVRRYDDAKEIARLSLEAMPAMQPTLGNLLRRLESGGPSDAARDQFIEEMKVQRWREESCLNCLHGY